MSEHARRLRCTELQLKAQVEEFPLCACRVLPEPSHSNWEEAAVCRALLTACTFPWGSSTLRHLRFLQLPSAKRLVVDVRVSADAIPRNLHYQSNVLPSVTLRHLHHLSRPPTALLTVVCRITKESTAYLFLLFLTSGVHGFILAVVALVFLRLNGDGCSLASPIRLL